MFIHSSAFYRSNTQSSERDQQQCNTPEFHLYSIPNYSFQDSDAVRVFMDKDATNIYMPISNKNSSTHILSNLQVDLKHRVFSPKTQLANDVYSDLKFHFMQPSSRRNIIYKYGL